MWVEGRLRQPVPSLLQQVFCLVVVRSWLQQVSHNLGLLVPKSFQDPRGNPSEFPKSGRVQHGLLGPVLSGSSLVPRVGQEDTRENAAVDVGSTVGLGNTSGWQVGHTGSVSAASASNNPVNPRQVLAG